MRKFWLAITLSLIFFSAQSQKNYALSALANFDFLATGLGINDAGVGFTLQSNFFAKNKLQFRTEASLDHFIGSKDLMVDSLGNHYYDNPTMIGLKGGPELHVTKHISLAVLYGYVQYKEFTRSIHSGLFKFVLTARPPRHPNMLIGFHFTKLANDYSYVHFCGISLGSRIL